MEKETQKPPFSGWPLVAALIITIFFVVIVMLWQNSVIKNTQATDTGKLAKIEQRLGALEKQTGIETGPTADQAAVEEDEDIVQIIKTDETASWTEYADDNFEFRYPEDFFYEDPKVVSVSCKDIDFPKECPNIDQAVEEVTGVPIKNSLASGLPSLYYWDNPKGEKILVNDVPYCLYRNIEGAAGSTFISYYYITVSGKDCLVSHFVLRYTNCSVYGTEGDEDYDNCIMENETTKPETLNKVISTFKVIE